MRNKTMGQWIALLVTVAVIVAVGAVITYRTAQTTTTIDTRVWVNYSDLQAGDCTDYAEVPPSGEDLFVLLECEGPHTTELYASLEHPAAAGEAYPGLDALRTWSINACEDAFVEYVGVDSVVSVYLVYGVYPWPDEWAAGERTIICELYRSDGQELTGSARDSRR